MIQVTGSAHRSFVFPADLSLTYAYYADVERLLNYLPHISLVRAYAPDRFRLLYRSTEMGIYQVRIFADVQTRLEEGWTLHIEPLDGIPPVEAQKGFHSSLAQGTFRSKSVFRQELNQTRIQYSLQLRADLPTPLGLRVMPAYVIDRLASGITRLRIREVVDGFIERSIDAYPHWAAEMANHGKVRG